MYGETGDNVLPRNNAPRPTRWIPAEVWQRQGMMAQEMTLPQGMYKVLLGYMIFILDKIFITDVIIPTSSQDKENIVLKAGERVMILRSTKGVYMQLETGKIIAIRTTHKPGQGPSPGIPNVDGSDLKSESDLINKDSVVEPRLVQGPKKNPDEVHNISDDDECVMTSVTYHPQTNHSNSGGSSNRNLNNYPSTSNEVSQAPPPPVKLTTAIETAQTRNMKNIPPCPLPPPEIDTPLREKVVYKPNLVPRKPKASQEEFGKSFTHDSRSSFGYHTRDSNNISGHSSYPAINGNHSGRDRYHDYPNRRGIYGTSEFGTGSSTSFSHATAQNFSSYREY